MGSWTTAPLTANPQPPSLSLLEGHTPGTPGTGFSSPKLPARGRAGGGSGRARLGLTLRPKLPQFPRDSPAGARAPPGRGVRCPGSARSGSAGLWLGSGAGRGWTGSALSPSRLGDTSPTPTPTLTLHLPRLQLGADPRPHANG